MDDRTEEVDIGLEAWARWAKRALGELGWPSTSLLAKMIKYGVRGAAQQSGIRVGESDYLCELVDVAVSRLPPLEHRIIVTEYMNWLPAEAAADSCQVTLGYYRVILHRARRSVADYLEGARLRFNFPQAIM